MRSGIDVMLDTIRREAEMTRGMTGRGEFDPRLLEVMRNLPREKFVPPEWQFLAYQNGPVSIGHGQTISQPYIVALMTDLLDIEQHHRLLEIGTGSGYQTCILSALAEQVYTVETIDDLAAQARLRLQEFGKKNVQFRVGDGHEGWPEFAPYDGIIVTAAATHIPPALLEQLKPGGRMVIPVGLHYMPQELLLVKKDQQGEVQVTSILGVSFVPLVQQEAYKSKKEYDG